MPPAPKPSPDQSQSVSSFASFQCAPVCRGFGASTPPCNLNASAAIFPSAFMLRVCASAVEPASTTLPSGSLQSIANGSGSLGFTSGQSASITLPVLSAVSTLPSLAAHSRVPSLTNVKKERSPAVVGKSARSAVLSAASSLRMSVGPLHLPLRKSHASSQYGGLSGGSLRSTSGSRTFPSAGGSSLW